MSRYLFSCLLLTACLGATAPLPAGGLLPAAEPSLLRWIGVCLSANPEIQAADAALAAARGRSLAAGRPLYNPELELEYEDSDTATTSGGLSQTIDWSDKRGAHAELSGFELQQAAAELRARRQDLAVRLLQALAQWHTAAAVAGVSRTQTGLMARFVELAERRRLAGDLGQIELDLAHLAAAEAGFARSAAEEARILAGRDLAELAGAGTAPLPDFPGRLPDLDPGQPVVAELLQDLPSLQAASARIGAARAGLQLRIRERQPDPTLGVRVGKEDSADLAGIRFSVPLHVRNTRSAEVTVARAELLQAEHEAANLRRQVLAQLEAAEQLYRNTRDAWSGWETAGALRLDQRTGLLERLWQAGELDTTDYLVQLKQTLDTAVSAIELRGRMWRAWADWLAASGQAEQWLDLTGGESQ